MHQVNTTMRQRQKRGGYQLPPTGAPWHKELLSELNNNPLMQLGSHWSLATRDIWYPSNWHLSSSQSFSSWSSWQSSSSSGCDQLQLSGLGRLRPLLCQCRDFLRVRRCHTFAVWSLPAWSISNMIIIMTTLMNADERLLFLIIWIPQIKHEVLQPCWIPKMISMLFRRPDYKGGECGN